MATVNTSAKFRFRQPGVMVGAVLCALCALPAQAHSVRATLDVTGDSATFTGMARVTCFNDGSGNAAYLTARVRDNSAPDNNLYVSLQIIKGTQAISVTDRTPGDASYSDHIALDGGTGVYTLLLNKTGPGARSFDLEWHCMTASHTHTGTDILVDQFK